MSPNNQTLLARIAIAVSVFALVMVGIVAVNDGGGSEGEAAADASAPSRSRCSDSLSFQKPQSPPFLAGAMCLFYISRCMQPCRR